MDRDREEHLVGLLLHLHDVLSQLFGVLDPCFRLEEGFCVSVQRQHIGV